AVALRSLLNTDFGLLSTLMNSGSYVSPMSRPKIDKLRSWLEAGTLGLRELVAAEHAVTVSRHAAMGREVPVFDPIGYLRSNLTGLFYNRRNKESPLKQLPAKAVWPWLADNLHIFDEALGLQPTPKPIALDRALATLELLPAVPQRHFA